MFSYYTVVCCHVAIPGFQKMMLPILKKLHECPGLWNMELTNFIGSRFNMSEEEKIERLRSEQLVVYNRVSWSAWYLQKANLIDKKRDVTKLGSEIISKDW